MFNQRKQHISKAKQSISNNTAKRNKMDVIPSVLNGTLSYSDDDNKVLRDDCNSGS